MLLDRFSINAPLVPKWQARQLWDRHPLKSTHQFDVFIKESVVSSIRACLPWHASMYSKLEQDANWQWIKRFEGF